MCAYIGLNQAHPTNDVAPSTNQSAFYDLFHSLLALAWFKLCSVSPKYRGYGPLDQNFFSLSGKWDL